MIQLQERTGKTKNKMDWAKSLPISRETFFFYGMHHWTSNKKRHDDENTLFVEMVLMRLIKADKLLAERIQKKFNLTNYQMLCLSWAIGLVMGIAIAILFF